MTVFQRHLTADQIRHDAARMAPLAELRAEIAALSGILAAMAGLVPPDLRGAVAAAQADLDAFDPAVTVIGQVKAGKTALTNALVGATDLLPSDVNPWTSVTTAVHLNRRPADGNGAVFHFFDEADWQRLIEHGGHLGAVSGRADAEGEADLLAEQVEALRARAAARLGSNYRLLLGRAHRFRDLSPEVVRRYVCAGDGAAGPGAEGRFADLTRAAELYMDAPEFAVPMTVTDTPGVNDPLLVREQMTIETLGRASVCVLVLSAYQALTAVDLGLMRLLRTLRPEQVVIFVNRVDELTDRAADTARIETALRATLNRHGLPGGVRVLFGSANWAHRAATGDLRALRVADWADLLDDAGASAGAGAGVGGAGTASADARPAALRTMRRLSGVPDLKAVLAERIAEGPGRDLVTGIAHRIRDILAQADLRLSVRAAPAAGLDPAHLGDRMDGMAETAARALAEIEADARDALAELNGAVVRPWIADALDDPARAGADGTLDTGDLRAALLAACEGVTDRARVRLSAMLDRVEADLSDLYRAAAGPAGAEVFAVPPPPVRPFGRPVALARSTAIDLRGGWREMLVLNGQARAARRAARVQAEAGEAFGAILDAIADGPLADGFAAAADDLAAFLGPHVRTLVALADADGTRSARLVTARAAVLRREHAALRARLDALIAGAASDARACA